MAYTPEYTPFSHINTPSKKHVRYYTCTVCGTASLTPKFCSAECKEQYKKINEGIKYGKNIQRRCRNCGDKIMTDTQYTFCCEACYIEYQRKLYKNRKDSLKNNI